MSTVRAMQTGRGAMWADYRRGRVRPRACHRRRMPVPAGLTPSGACRHARCARRWATCTLGASVRRPSRPGPTARSSPPRSAAATDPEPTWTDPGSMWADAGASWTGCQRPGATSQRHAAAPWSPPCHKERQPRQRRAWACRCRRWPASQPIECLMERSTAHSTTERARSRRGRPRSRPSRTATSSWSAAVQQPH